MLRVMAIARKEQNSIMVLTIFDEVTIIFYFFFFQNLTIQPGNFLFSKCSIPPAQCPLIACNMGYRFAQTPRTPAGHLL